MLSTPKSAWWQTEVRALEGLPVATELVAAHSKAVHGWQYFRASPLTRPTTSRDRVDSIIQLSEPSQ